MHTYDELTHRSGDLTAVAYVKSTVSLHTVILFVEDGVIDMIMLLNRLVAKEGTKLRYHHRYSPYHAVLADCKH